MYSVYRALVFLHVVAILAFLLMHGAAMTVGFALSRERQLDRVRTFATLSLQAMDSQSVIGRAFWIIFLVVPISGVALMGMGGWWRMGWSWASLVVFVAIMAAMTVWGRMPMNEVRRTSGLPYVKGSGKPVWEPAEPSDQAAMEVALTKLHPERLLAAGLGGFVILAWLMMYKPF